jgi:hypothetical protein
MESIEGARSDWPVEVLGPRSGRREPRYQPVASRNQRVERRNADFFRGNAHFWTRIERFASQDRRFAIEDVHFSERHAHFRGRFQHSGTQQAHFSGRNKHSSPQVRRDRLLFANRHRPPGLSRRARTIGNRFQAMPDREDGCKLSRHSHQNLGFVALATNFGTETLDKLPREIMIPSTCRECRPGSTGALGDSGRRSTVCAKQEPQEPPTGRRLGLDSQTEPEERSSRKRAPWREDPLPDVTATEEHQVPWGSQVRVHERRSVA